MELSGEMHDPRSLILARLQVYAARHRPCVPDMTTLRFLKARLLPQHHMHSVTFVDSEGCRWHFTYFLDQLTNGVWYISGGSGSPEREKREDQDTWLRLRNHFRENQFYAGGEVIAHGHEIVRVRLVSPDGQMFEDSVQDDLVLFWSDQTVRCPMRAELYDRAGELVHSESVLGIPMRFCNQNMERIFRNSSVKNEFRFLMIVSLTSLFPANHMWGSHRVPARQVICSVLWRGPSSSTRMTRCHVPSSRRRCV